MDIAAESGDQAGSRLSLLEKAVAAAMYDCRPDTVRWNYENGLVLLAVRRASTAHFGGAWNEAVKARVEALVARDGSISGYRPDEYNIDQINFGKLLLELWKETGAPSYRAAIQALLGQLELHPRTSTGSFWHKKIYPNQVWLDGLYMGGPFLAACGLAFGAPALVNDVCAQLLEARDRMRIPESGLYRHAWDSSGAMPWADPATGLSPHVWGRALGWLSMALVDILEILPPSFVRRGEIGSMFSELAASVIGAQDAGGLWWQVMDKPAEPGNYLETSASAMFAYSLLKGERLGLLGLVSAGGAGTGTTSDACSGTALDAGGFARAGMRALDALIRERVSFDPDGRFHLVGICKVAGLGGKPYRDGSYAYYLSEPVVADDYKGSGPFIMALVEACR